jgi:hypothetical protein
MSLEIPNQNPLSVREKYLSKVDKDGFVYVGDFSTQELRRQSKSVAAFLDGEEGAEPNINLGNGIRFKGSSGNYSDMKVHIDDLEEFIERVRNYYGD